MRWRLRCTHYQVNGFLVRISALPTLRELSQHQQTLLNAERTRGKQRGLPLANGALGLDANGWEAVTIIARAQR